MVLIRGQEFWVWGLYFNPTTKQNHKKYYPKSKTNRITILNGQGLTLKEKNIFTNSLTALSKARIEKTIQPFLLLIEDAENLKGEALEEIITSKTGIAIILVTSHPTELGRKMLAQMGNQIIGKTTDPTDIAYLRNMLNCTEEELPNLNVGEWIINSLNLIRPTKVQVKKSNSNEDN